MRAPLSHGLNRRVSWLELGACVAWCGAAMVSVIGTAIPYERAVDAAAPPAPPPVEAIDVELFEAASPRQAETRAEPPEIPAAPDAPEPIEIAEPKPLARVARPMVEVAVPQLAASSVSSAAPPPVASGGSVASSKTVAGVSNPAGASDAAIEELTFGVGAGRQPAPTYPRSAARERQEGAVTVTFEVDPTGRTRDVEVTDPCPWPLLNHEAARVIRARWRFAKDEPRRYRVTIEFRMAS